MDDDMVVVIIINGLLGVIYLLVMGSDTSSIQASEK
jgi:hypothetical protein